MDYGRAYYIRNVHGPQQRLMTNTFILLVSCICIGFHFATSSDYGAVKSRTETATSLFFSNTFGRPTESPVPSSGTVSLLRGLLPFTYIGSVVVQLGLIVAILTAGEFSIKVEIVFSAIWLILFLASGISAVVYAANYLTDPWASNPGLHYAKAMFSFFTAFILFVKTISLTYHLRHGSATFIQAPNATFAPEEANPTLHSGHGGATFGASQATAPPSSAMVNPYTWDPMEPPPRYDDLGKVNY